MCVEFYAYSEDQFLKLKEEYTKYDFVSFGYVFSIAPTYVTLTELEIDYFSGKIIDLSYLSDVNLSILFFDQYLNYLFNTFENTMFIFNDKYSKKLTELFPYTISKINKKFVSFIETNDSNTTIKPFNNINVGRIPLVIYNRKNYESLSEDLDNISISNFFLITESMSISYDIPKICKIINENKTKCIDISIAISLVSQKKELLSIFGSLFQIIYVNSSNINFVINENYEEQIIELYPFVFQISKFNQNDGDNKEGTYLKQYSEETREYLDKHFRGHKIFKKDFMFNLNKFEYLLEFNQREILSIFLLGESGIGKTEFAKIISDAMYPNEKLIKINFGNYSTQGVLNSLIGSPKGFLGSEEGGELINKMEKSKSKIVLIDEFEKADPSVFNFFYELLEDGSFTDRQGYAHSMRGFIIIFTSNITEEKYINEVPNSLKSRFDMVYNFNPLERSDKMEFIQETATNLITLLNRKANQKIKISCIEPFYNELLGHTNLRIIKREVENIVYRHFFESNN